MTSLANNSPQLSIAGLAIDPLGLGDKAGGGDSKHPDVHGLCLRRYCAFLNKKLASVARDPVIEPANGFHDKGANIHSSVLCCAGANGCEDALLGVANMKGVLLNHAAACVRIPNADPSRADLWRLDLTPSALLELLGRQNSPSCSFVIGTAGSGKTQLLLALAKQCSDSANSESLCLHPVVLHPGVASESPGRTRSDAPALFVESLLRSAAHRVAADAGNCDESGLASHTSPLSSTAEFEAALTSALLAVCPSRRLLLIYDANELSQKGDLFFLIQACRAGCHVIISGQDDSVIDAWAMEECNSNVRASRPSSSLKLALLPPERQSMVIGGVQCDPAGILGELPCLGVHNWWLLQNAVRFHMLSTPHNRHIASGRIPPFGPALRLQTWNRLIFDAMNWEGTRLNAHSLLFSETPQTGSVAGKYIRDTLLLLGRVAFASKSRGESVSDAAFIKWLLDMPAYVGVTAHDARLVLFSLKRSGLLVIDGASAQSGSDVHFRLCCPGVACAALSLLSKNRIIGKLGALWAWQSDAATWNSILCAAWLHQVDCREWLVYTLLQLKEAFRQRAIMSLLSSTDPTNADACILIHAYASILTEQAFPSENDTNHAVSTSGDCADDMHAQLAPPIEPAQHDFYMRVCELARNPWWDMAVHKAALSVSSWVQDVALDVVIRLRIENSAVLKAAACALTSPSTSMTMKLGAACALGRIQISPSAVASLVTCAAESGVHQELRKQCMLSLLCVSYRLRSEFGDSIDGGTESHAAISSNLLVVAAVRFACDMEQDVSCIARCICERHRSQLLAFIHGTQSPHEFSQRWLVSGDCACASASAASTISSFQGDEAFVGALLHLLKRGDKVASISAASALAIIADPSIRVVQECTQAFLNQHGNGDIHWNAARTVLAKTLCDLVARGVCPDAIYSMCDVVVNGLEKVLGIKDREAEIHQVAMTSTLTHLLDVVSLESQDKSRRYVIVDTESEIFHDDTSRTFILRSDIAEAKRLAILVIGQHVSAHGWVDGLLGLSTAQTTFQNTEQLCDDALNGITAIAMSDAHVLQHDALAAVMPFLKLKNVPPAVTNVIVWISERLTLETEALHNFMNSAPSEAAAHEQTGVCAHGDMDLALKDMFLPADMRQQSVLVSSWQSAGKNAWLQLIMRCKLVLQALRCDFLGKDTGCICSTVDMCANSLQMLSRCLDLYDLPVKRSQLVDAVLNYWTAVNNCKFNSMCASNWAIAILSTSNSLSFGVLSMPEIPRYAPLIDERIVDAVKNHLFLACALIRERDNHVDVFDTFADLKHELWRMTIHLAANDVSVLHRAQWQRVAVAIACESSDLEWIAEARGLLLSGLMDPAKVVRHASAELFGAFVDRRAELLHSLRPYMLSRSPDCRLRGIEASLVLFSSPGDGMDVISPKDRGAYVEFLSSMLHDENIAVRCAVIGAISQVDSQGVYFRNIVQLLDDPAVDVRLASARVVVGKKMRDVGVASVILGAIVAGKTRSINQRAAELHAIDAISQVGANSPLEWANLLGCIGIASTDSSESMSLMASSSLAKGAGLLIRSAHAAMDIIPLLNDRTACGPAVQVLATFTERFCSFPTVFRTPVPRVIAASTTLSPDVACAPLCIPYLDASVRALPAACCRSISEAVVKLKQVDALLQSCEPLIFWWFCRVHGLIPFGDADFQNNMQWMNE